MQSPGQTVRIAASLTVALAFWCCGAGSLPSSGDSGARSAEQGIIFWDELSGKRAWADVYPGAGSQQRVVFSLQSGAASGDGKDISFSTIESAFNPCLSGSNPLSCPTKMDGPWTQGDADPLKAITWMNDGRNNWSILLDPANANLALSAEQQPFNALLSPLQFDLVALIPGGVHKCSVLATLSMRAEATLQRVEGALAPPTIDVTVSGFNDLGASNAGSVPAAAIGQVNYQLVVRAPGVQRVGDSSLSFGNTVMWGGGCQDKICYGVELPSTRAPGTTYLAGLKSAAQVQELFRSGGKISVLTMAQGSAAIYEGTFPPPALAVQTLRAVCEDI